MVNRGRSLQARIRHVCKVHYVDAESGNWEVWKRIGVGCKEKGCEVESDRDLENYETASRKTGSRKAGERTKNLLAKK